MSSKLKEIIALQHSLPRHYDLMLHAVHVLIGRIQGELKRTLSKPNVAYVERIRGAIHHVKRPPLFGGIRRLRVWLALHR